MWKKKFFLSFSIIVENLWKFFFNQKLFHMKDTHFYYIKIKTSNNIIFIIYEYWILNFFFF